ncbi:MAG: VWA domain-containing protein, partial [Thiotrichaceae bacterium]
MMIRLEISRKIFFLIGLMGILCLPWLSIATYASDDVIIILDQSKSMKEKVPGNENLGYENDPSKTKKSKGAIEAVNQVVSDFLKEGDYFAFIVFGDKAELRLSQEISYKHERELIVNQLKTLNFEDRKTDILAGLKEASDLLNKSLHIP